MGVLADIAGEITGRGAQYDQNDLEQMLSRLYEPHGLAAMVMHRYQIVPVIQDYRETIAEAIEAHFFGLDHIAVGGLLPVIEGAGRQLAASRSVAQNGTQAIFSALLSDCKHEAYSRRMGEPTEIEAMMDSFGVFVKETLKNTSAVGASIG